MQGGKAIASFCLYHPHPLLQPQVSIAQLQTATSQLQRVSLTGGGTLRRATSFPTLLRLRTKVLIWFHLKQAVELRCYRDAGAGKNTWAAKSSH